MKNNKGFSLVELIVVIAIMAILAAVAVIGVSVYIPKAQQAADDQLIADINKVATAAVVEAWGEDMVNLPDGKLVSNATKGKNEITVYSANPSEVELHTVFDQYFAGNEEASLKWYGSLRFEGGKFVGVESKLTGALYDPTEGKVATAFKDSNYNMETLRVDGLTTMVDDLAGALADYEFFNLISSTEAFQQTLEDMGIPSNADAQTMANASVFYLAACLNKLPQDELYEHLAAGDLGDYLTGQELAWGDDTVTLAAKDVTFIETALKYAAATAFVHSELGNEDLRNTMFQTPADKNAALANITAATDDPNYEFYVENAGEADFNAFYQIMMVLNGNQETFNDVEGGSLFSNAETQAAINELLNRTP